jgi:hypothetical protein
VSLVHLSGPHWVNPDHVMAVMLTAPDADSENSWRRDKWNIAVMLPNDVTLQAWRSGEAQALELLGLLGGPVQPEFAGTVPAVSRQ